MNFPMQERSSNIHRRATIILTIQRNGGEIRTTNSAAVAELISMLPDWYPGSRDAHAVGPLLKSMEGEGLVNLHTSFHKVSKNITLGVWGSRIDNCMTDIVAAHPEFFTAPLPLSIENSAVVNDATQAIARVLHPSSDVTPMFEAMKVRATQLLDEAQEFYAEYEKLVDQAKAIETAVETLQGAISR